MSPVATEQTNMAPSLCLLCTSFTLRPLIALREQISNAALALLAVTTYWIYHGHELVCQPLRVSITYLFAKHTSSMRQASSYVRWPDVGVLIVARRVVYRQLRPFGVAIAIVEMKVDLSMLRLFPTNLKTWGFVVDWKRGSRPVWV